MKGQGQSVPVCIIRKDRLGLADLSSASLSFAASRREWRDRGSPRKVSEPMLATRCPPEPNICQSRFRISPRSVEGVCQSIANAWRMLNSARDRHFVGVFYTRHREYLLQAATSSSQEDWAVVRPAGNDPARIIGQSPGRSGNQVSKDRDVPSG